jgi:SM-20-related protein
MQDPSSLAGRFLPHRVIASWLGEDRAESLLSYALSAEARFKPTKVGDDDQGEYDPTVRQSRVLKDLGPFTGLLREKALALQPDLETAFGMGRASTKSTQIELVAHADGGFYQSHIDTFTGGKFTPGDSRRLSLVYYLHRRPRRFAGGRLRLFDLVGRQTIDIDPAHDSLLAFPSFACHEVELVSCPGGDFADSRFSVNIWLNG